MKKIFKMMFAVVAGIAALTACTNEPEEEGITPEAPSTDEYVIVKVGMPEGNRSFTDAEGIKWNVGNVLYFGGAGALITSEALTAEDIVNEGYTANFKFPAALNQVNRTGWFTTSGRNVAEVDFVPDAVGGNVYSQTEAGVMNPNFIFLHSGTGLTSITQGEAPDVTMDVVGSIFRIMPYTEQYNDERVQWVELASNNGTLIVGTAMYDRGVEKYNGINQGWNAGRNSKVRVMLTDSFELTNANSRENSKGIYMALARTTEERPIVGYTYTVKTNKATYTFSSDENLVVGENEVKNVYLKLENGTRELVEPDVLTFVNGGIVNKNLTASAEAQANINLGYLVAVVNGSEMRNYSLYPELVCVSLEDYNKGDFSNPVDWMSAHMATNANGVVTDCVWFVDIEENTESEIREGVIVQDWSKSGLYIGDNLTPAVRVTQNVAGTAKVLTFNPGVGDKTLTNDAQTWDHGYFVIFSNGTQLEAGMVNIEEAQLLYNCIEIICHDMSTGLGAGAPAADWISLSYGMTDGKYSDAWLHGKAEKNSSPVQRQVLVGIYMTPPAGYEFSDGKTERKMLRQFIITQEAYKATIAATLTNAYTGTVGHAGEEITVGNLALTADGVAVADATEYCNVTINGGASVVLATDGTITATIPANASSSAKEYTVAIKNKSGNALVENVIIAQDANPEGGTVVEPTDVYSYTIGNWSKLDGNLTRNWSFGSGESNPVEHWVIVIQNVKKNDVLYTSDMPDEDKKALICQMFKWTSEEYDNAFAELTVFWGAGETIIKLTHIKANTGGARELSGNIYEADGATVAVTYKWNQDPA